MEEIAHLRSMAQVEVRQPPNARTATPYVNPGTAASYVNPGVYGAIGVRIGEAAAETAQRGVSASCSAGAQDNAKLKDIQRQLNMLTNMLATEKCHCGHVDEHEIQINILKQLVSDMVTAERTHGASDPRPSVSSSALARPRRIPNRRRMMSRRSRRRMRP